MLAAAQCFFQQLDAFDGALTLGSQFGAAECLPQFFQPLVVAAGDGAQTVRLTRVRAGFASCFMGWFQSTGCMVHFIVYATTFRPTIFKPTIRKGPECARKS
jgi:hypothetical protein